MKRIPMIAAVAGAAMASNAFGASYSTTGTAGVITVDAFITPTLIYSSPSANPPVSGDWDFTFNGGTVDFSGEIYLGDYSTYTAASFLGSNMDGTITYVGASHLVSGTGNWDAGTNTLTYNVMGASGSGVASDYSETSSSCTGTGSIASNTVCGTASQVDPDWEGLTLSFVFSGDLSSFSGSIVGTSQSGTSLAANTTDFNYTIAGTELTPVPVPAAAWLFGSALLGLAGVGRRRAKA